MNGSVTDSALEIAAYVLGADISPLRVVSFGQDSDQEIYLVAIERNPGDPIAPGVLYQITDPTL